MIRALLAALVLSVLVPLSYGAQQTIGVGSVANDGTGDAGRVAFQKVNANFDELYLQAFTPAAPFSMGTSITPAYLNAYNITGTVTANALTFVCVTGCGSLAVGQYVSGSDGVNLLYPALSSQFAAVITNIASTTITTSIASNAALTPGTYTITVGSARWSSTSTALANTIGVKNLWVGQATTGNSTWAQLYLANDCDTLTKTTSCILMNSGGTYNNFWGARTSDAPGGIEANISLAVNDDTGSGKDMWNHYWETILLSGAGTGKQAHALESSVYNFNSASQLLYPYGYNVGSTVENLRLSSGQAGLGTMYHASDAISIVPINSTGFETGILFANGSLDVLTVTTPPAIALPVNYSISWYRSGQSYSQRTWTLFSSDSTANANTFDLQAAAVVASMVTATGTPTDSLTPGGIAFAGNYTSATGFGTTGVGINVAAQTIKDSIIANSGTVAQTWVHEIGVPTLTTTGTAVTLTAAATLNIDNAPAAGTNVTIGSPLALRVGSGATLLNGTLTAASGITANGGGSIINNTGSSTTTVGAGTSSGTVTIGNSSGPNIVNIAAGTTQLDGRMYESATDPAIASGFNTASYSITGTNTASFQVTVGTSTGTSVGVVTMPTATTGWACSVSNVTNSATSLVEESAYTTTSVTVTNYVRTTGVAGNFTNSDKLVFVCGAF